MLTFRIKTPAGPGNPTRDEFRGVVEEPKSGALYWVEGEVPRDPKTGYRIQYKGEPRYFLADYANLLGKKVKPKEAMILTGIDHPMAAMDRLREMCHEERSS